MLDETCGGDGDLGQVESLLEANEQAGSFLAPAQLGSEIAELEVGPAPLVVGDGIGHYQLISEIGEPWGLARDTRLGRQVSVCQVY